MCTGIDGAPSSVAEALRMANATMDYLNGQGGAELDAAACGPVLRALAGVQAKFTAAHAAVLAKFDAAGAHDGDGYGTSASWLMAMTDTTRADAKAEVRQMRLLRDHPALAAALAGADISRSWALAIATWTKELPAELPYPSESCAPAASNFASTAACAAVNFACTPASDRSTGPHAAASSSPAPGPFR